MTEWIYFIHPPRDNVAATMTDAEREVWRVQFERPQRLIAEGTLIHGWSDAWFHQHGHCRH